MAADIQVGDSVETVYGESGKVVSIVTRQVGPAPEDLLDPQLKAKGHEVVKVKKGEPTGYEERTDANGTAYSYWEVRTKKGEPVKKAAVGTLYLIDFGYSDSKRSVAAFPATKLKQFASKELIELVEARKRFNEKREAYKASLEGGK